MILVIALPEINSTSPVVALRGVGKTFGTGTLALSGFDLDVRHGEFLSLLGPSGCGKSTALRIMAGLASPQPVQSRGQGRTPPGHRPRVQERAGAVATVANVFRRWGG